jgi:hypothetical protein
MDITGRIDEYFNKEEEERSLKLFEAEKKKQYSITEGKQKRPLSEIAREIYKDWGSKVNFAAKPYLEAMLTLNSINDMYMFDSARSIVAYFLSNARSWKGPKAKEIKKELKDML